jgi:hypothetical protein
MYIINIEMKVRFDPGKALVVKQKLSQNSFQKPFVSEEV